MNRINYLSIFILVLLFLVSIFSYSNLSDFVPSHFNMQGNVDDYSSKIFFIFGVPILSCIIFLLLYFLPRFDPLKENYKYFQKYYDGFILMFVLFMFYLQLLVLVFGLGYKFNFILAMVPAFFFLFLYIGLLLKHTKRNYFVGIRTPWTLQSETVWDKTHAFGSKLFIASSIICLLGLVFQSIAFILLIVPIILSAIISFVYSYFIFKKGNNNLLKKSKK